MAELDDREDSLRQAVAEAYEVARREVFDSGRQEDDHALDPRQRTALIALENAEHELQLYRRGRADSPQS